MDVGDDTSRFIKTRIGEEIGRRREILSEIAQRSHEPSQGLAEVVVIVDDRDQYFLSHATSGISLDLDRGALRCRRRFAWTA
jgi:hypothetical protein